MFNKRMAIHCTVLSRKTLLMKCVPTAVGAVLSAQPELHCAALHCAMARGLHAEPLPQLLRPKLSSLLTLPSRPALKLPGAWIRLGWP